MIFFEGAKQKNETISHPSKSLLTLNTSKEQKHKTSRFLKLLSPQMKNSILTYSWIGRFFVFAAFYPTPSFLFRSSS